MNLMPGNYDVKSLRAGVRSLPVFGPKDAAPNPPYKVAFCNVHTREEKGSDVNLAVHLLHRGWKGEYDRALVFSNDSDLAEAVRIVRDERLAARCQKS